MEHGSTDVLTELFPKTEIQKNMERIMDTWSSPLMNMWAKNVPAMQTAIQMLYKYFPPPQFDLSSLKSAAPVDILSFAVQLFGVVFKALTECSEVNHQHQIADADSICARYTLFYLDKILEDLKKSEKRGKEIERNRGPEPRGSRSIEGSNDQTPEKKREENFDDLTMRGGVEAWSNEVAGAHREFKNIVLILKTMLLQKMEHDGTHTKYSQVEYTKAYAKGLELIGDAVTMLHQEGQEKIDRQIVAQAMVQCYLGPSCQSLESLGSTLRSSHHLQPPPPTASQARPAGPAVSASSLGQQSKIIKSEEDVSMSNNALAL